MFRVRVVFLLLYTHSFYISFLSLKKLHNLISQIMDDDSFSKLHALVLPFPAQGHINPLLYFSAQLALRGATITFVNTHRSHERMLKARQGSHAHGDDLGIRFVVIPDGLPEGQNSVLDSSFESLLTMLEGVEKQKGLVEELIKSSRSEAHPISCVVADLFLPWTRDLAKKLGIPTATFWTSNATRLYLSPHKYSATNDCKTEELCIPGQSFLEKEMLSIREEMRSECLVDPRKMKINTERSLAIQDAACIIVNTFRELEGPLLNEGLFPNPVRFVGPLLPPEFQTEGKLSVGGNLPEEEANCLRWLDTHAASSVLYISFGSFVTVPPSEFEELALGIEASKQPFLWVIRTRTEANRQLLEGLVERTQDRGLVISWAPQLLVLSHPSIGGFLTHCGWNSVLESISRGVPMVGWPIFADQPLNLLLMGKLWKVGMEFKRKEDGKVGKEEVERGVRVLMQSEEGKELRRRCCELRDAARRGVGEGGASAMNFRLFAEDMLQKQESLK